MMTEQEAAYAVVSWLKYKPIAFLSAVSAHEIGTQRFRIGIQQVAPVTCQRVFELVPLEMADCYEVREVKE